MSEETLEEEYHPPEAALNVDARFERRGLEEHLEIKVKVGEQEKRLLEDFTL